MKPELLAINPEYFHRLFNWKNIKYEFVGNLFKVDGFSEHNKLLELNGVFSSYPFGEPVDRTHTIKAPLKFKVLRDWKIPSSCLEFDDVVKKRVQELTESGRKINICWSGGIDSTTVLVGFLKHATDLSQLRVVYSPFSVYENRAFLEFVHKNFPQVETLDISGNVYLETHFDGIFVNGHCGDEFVSSLDDSFYDKVGGDGLYGSWKDYFRNEGKDSAFIEFCEKHFSNAGKPIETVLDARWWFYASTKSQVFQISDMVFLNNQKDFKVEDSVGFYDTYDFEHFIYFNPELIIEDRHKYSTHKNFMKKYIFEFDKNEDYFINKEKSNSTQLVWYIMKKTFMLDARWVARLSDSTIIRTPNLPFFSKKEFDKLYGDSLDYLFNEPDHA